VDVANPFDLSGKTAIVTGANTGLGQGIALALADAGARVVGVGRSPMDDTQTQVEADGGKFLSVSADLSEASTFWSITPA
jgi:2-deoxy-D-gluconate 3-dehydrogenase